MRLALAQLNPLVGDITGNADGIREAFERGVDAGSDLVAVGELAVTGYPPEDLVLKPAFLEAVGDAIAELATAAGSVPLVVGFAERLPADPKPSWRAVASEATTYPPLANAAAVLRNGRVEAVYRKHRLPNYGVFDEARYFHAGSGGTVFDAAGARVAVTVCEDLWGDGGPVPAAAAAGADLVLNLNASPYGRGKRAEREHWARRHAGAGGTWLAYLNQTGGQDEVVFDGDSFVLGPDGTVAARGAQFATDLVVVDLPVGEDPRGPEQLAGGGGPRLDPTEEAYAALVLGTGDYVRKNGFKKALVGLSGGIDSTLTAVVAVDALGADAVTGVGMPSPYTSPGSRSDAEKLAGNLGIRYFEMPIASLMEAFDQALAEPFAGTEPGVAEENIQSRIRGTLLMALSNKWGDILLATGNKSEYAVGYSTLYGDMAGGFAVLKDVSKLLVFELSEHRNAAARRRGEDPPIPQTVIDKPPSAELRPDQRDVDSLPPYETLDPILEGYVERDESVADLVAAGHDEDIVRRVAALVDRAEYKRRQAPPGVKITPRAFGKDRRLPITQRWSG